MGSNGYKIRVDSMKKIFIKVKNQFIAVHQWENAPEESILRNPHRHVFHVTSTISVNHKERELEFFEVQKIIEKSVVVFQGYVHGESCETMASFLYEVLKSKCGEDRLVSVEVSEDNENSAIVGDI